LRKRELLLRREQNKGVIGLSIDRFVGDSRDITTSVRVTEHSVGEESSVGVR